MNKFHVIRELFENNNSMNLDFDVNKQHSYPTREYPADVFTDNLTIQKIMRMTDRYINFAQNKIFEYLIDDVNNIDIWNRVNIAYGMLSMHVNISSVSNPYYLDRVKSMKCVYRYISQFDRIFWHIPGGACMAYMNDTVNGLSNMITGVHTMMVNQAKNYYNVIKNRKDRDGNGQVIEDHVNFDTIDYTDMSGLPVDCDLGIVNPEDVLTNEQKMMIGQFIPSAEYDQTYDEELIRLVKDIRIYDRFKVCVDKMNAHITVTEQDTAGYTDKVTCMKAVHRLEAQIHDVMYGTDGVMLTDDAKPESASVTVGARQYAYMVLTAMKAKADTVFAKAYADIKARKDTKAGTAVTDSTDYEHIDYTDMTGVPDDCDFTKVI
jgi:hypothetical protein